MDSQSHGAFVTLFFFNIQNEKTAAHDVSHYLLNMQSETPSFILLKVLKPLDTLQKLLKLLQFVSFFSIACNLHAFCLLLFITLLMTNTIVTSPKNHCRFIPERSATAWSKLFTRLKLVMGSLLQPPCPRKRPVLPSKSMNNNK